MATTNERVQSTNQSPEGNRLPNGAGSLSDEPGRSSESSQTAGEKIGSFFRHAVDRLSGRDEDRRDEPREGRQFRAGRRPGEEEPDASRGSGRLGWSDLGRRDADDGRKQSFRSGRSGDGGEYGGSGRPTGNRPGTPYGQGEQFGRAGSSVGQQSGFAQRPDQPDRDRWNAPDRPRDDLRNQGSGSSYSGGAGLGGQSADQAALGRSPGGGIERGFADTSGPVRDPGDWEDRFRSEDEGRRDASRRSWWQKEPLAARDVMTRNVKTLTREDSVQRAAELMRDENCGIVPVVDGEGRLLGVLTDRDIVVRALAQQNTAARVADVMTDEISAVTEDEPLTTVLDLMGRKQVRRVPVVDRDDRLLGIIAMADIANRADYDEDLQQVFERISSRRSFWSLFT